MYYIVSCVFVYDVMGYVSARECCVMGSAAGE